jgi:hypothetical protein
MLQSGRFAAQLLNSEGLWCEILRPPPRCLPALFLDRDGVVIEETGYLCRVDDIVVAANLAGECRTFATFVAMPGGQGALGSRSSAPSGLNT